MLRSDPLSSTLRMAINDEVLSPHEKKDDRVLNDDDNEDVPVEHGDAEMEKLIDLPLDVLAESARVASLILLNQKKSQIFHSVFQSRGLFFV